MLFLPLILGTALLMASPALTAAKGKKSKKNQVKLKQPKLLPAINTQFRIPERLKPTEDQKKQMAQIRAKHGANLQLLTRYITGLQRIRTAMNSKRKVINDAAGASHAGIKIPGLGVNTRNSLRGNLSAQKKRVDALLKQYGTQKKKLESEIRKRIDNMLTPEQKTELATMKAEQAAKKNAAKKKAAKGKKKKK